MRDEQFYGDGFIEDATHIRPRWNLALCQSTG